MTSKSKTYFHRTPGAKFYMPDGAPLTFSAGDGSFVTDRLDIQQELDKIADVPASHVYTKQIVKPSEEKAVIAEMTQSAVGAFDADKKIAGNPETVPMHMTAPEKPTLQGAATAGHGEGISSQLAAAAAAVRDAGKPKAATGTVSNTGAGGGTSAPSNSK